MRSGWLADLAGTSEMADRVALHPWEATPLGSPDTWPDALRITVSIALTSRFPMLVVWGPELIKIYNDGYRPILGEAKHPQALGAPVREVWPEIWSEIGPLFDHVFATGESTWTKDGLLVIERHGFAEEAWFTWSYSPIRSADGTIEGVLDTVVETTTEVLARRRLLWLSQLAGRLVGCRAITDSSQQAVAALAGCPDLPTAEISLLVDGKLVPVATNGRPLLQADEAEALVDLAPGSLLVLDDDWVPGRPARRGALAVGEDDDARGLLVVALNPRLPFDDAYRELITLAGRTIGASLATAYRRSSELGEQRRISDTLQLAMLQPAADFPTVAGRYLPAAGNLSVGGDWYDILDLGDGRRGLVLGDCVGHGLDAATAMGALRNAGRALLADGRSPAEVLGALDRFAATVDGALCATAVCAVVDTRALTLTYARAGHLPPILVRDGLAVELAGGRGLPLAVDEGRRRDEATVDLRHGDLLALYTDGLVERKGEPIDTGIARLLDALGRHGDQPVQVIADRTIDELVGAAARDDVALVVKRVL